MIGPDLSVGTNLLQQKSLVSELDYWFTKWSKQNDLLHHFTVWIIVLLDNIWTRSFYDYYMAQELKGTEEMGEK